LATSAILQETLYTLRGHYGVTMISADVAHSLDGVINTFYASSTSRFDLQDLFPCSVERRFLVSA
jgi:hypothetical protein